MLNLLRPATFRLLFWLSTAFAVTMALLPKPPHTPLDRFGDKVAHIVAFTVLAALANIGYPQAARYRLVGWLSVLGAAIEVVQAVPALHRDSDVRDWIADSLAVVVVTLAFAVWRRRRETAA